MKGADTPSLIAHLSNQNTIGLSTVSPPPKKSIIPAEVYGNDLPEPPKSLGAHLSHSVSQNPFSVALISLHQSDFHHQPLKWTYAHLYSEAGKLAAAWQAHGLEKGSPVVVMLPNCAEYALSMWAAARLGALFVPLSIGIISLTDGMQKHFGKVRPESVVVSDHKILERLAREGALDGVKVGIYVEEFGEVRLNNMIWRSMHQMLNTAYGKEICFEDPNVNPEKDTALMVFTSGTTGLPKACPHTGRNISAATYNYICWRNLDRHRSLLQHLPNNTVSSCMNHISWWRTGGTVVYPSPSFNAKATLETLESGFCSDMYVWPSIFKTLIMHSSLNPQRIKNLKGVYIAGNMVSRAFPSEARDRLSANYASVNFGMSEGMGLLGWHLDEKICNSGNYVGVGKAGYGVGIKICEPGSRYALSRGELGEMHVAGSSIISEYVGYQSDDFYLDNKGRHWLITGDQAKMDESGSVYILGRYKDLIMTDGKNVSSSALEASLNKFEGINAQVVGIPDDLVEELPIAIIEHRKGDKLPALSALYENAKRECGTTLARIIFLCDLGLDRFPTTFTGKVKKTELKKIVSHYLGRIESVETG